MLPPPLSAVDVTRLQAEGEAQERDFRPIEESYGDGAGGRRHCEHGSLGVDTSQASWLIS